MSEPLTSKKLQAIRADLARYDEGETGIVVMETIRDLLAEIDRMQKHLDEARDFDSGADFRALVERWKDRAAAAEAELETLRAFADVVHEAIKTADWTAVVRASASLAAALSSDGSDDPICPRCRVRYSKGGLHGPNGRCPDRSAVPLSVRPTGEGEG